MCLYPKLIKNKKYLPNKKNNGNPPTIKDERTLYVPVGCGNCIECRKQIARSWQCRLNEEIKNHKQKYFVTLTFNEEELNSLYNEIIYKDINNKIEENEIATLAVRRFLELWRKNHKKSVKHWLITELGHHNTQRIHLHGIIFTEYPLDIPYYWKYGIVDLGKYVNEKTVNYIVKYVTKIDQDHKGYKPKILCSKGIGKSYLNKIDSKRNTFNGKNTKEYYTTNTGIKINLPTYYKNHIYNENQREELWLIKLDKNIRYICGNKIDISNDENNYYNTLKIYQLKNKRLGYGDNTIDWDIKIYKKQRALLKHNLKFKHNGNTN